MINDDPSAHPELRRLGREYAELMRDYPELREDFAAMMLRVEVLEAGFEVAAERFQSGLCPRCAASQDSR